MKKAYYKASQRKKEAEGLFFGRREHTDRGVESFGATFEYMDVRVPDAPGAQSGLRTNMQCLRHRQNFRLALDALTMPKNGGYALI